MEKRISFLFILPFLLSFLLIAQENTITIETEPENCQVKVYKWVPFENPKGKLLIEGNSPLKIPEAKLKDMRGIVIEVSKEGYKTFQLNSFRPFEDSYNVKLEKMEEKHEKGTKENKIWEKQKPKVVDIEKIWEELNRKCPPKGEFETTKEYINRVLSFRDDDIIYSKRSCCPIYDADNSLLKISLFSLSIPECSLPPLYLSKNHNYDALRGGLNEYPAIMMKMKTIKIGSYIGTNAFGAKCKVRVESTDFFLIFPLNGEEIVEELNLKKEFGIIINSVISIPVNREFAKSFLKNRENIELVVIWKPAAGVINDRAIPVVFQTYSHINPTFDSPEDASFSRRYMTGIVYHIFLYNPDTNMRIDIFPCSWKK